MELTPPLPLPVHQNPVHQNYSTGVGSAGAPAPPEPPPKALQRPCKGPVLGANGSRHRHKRPKICREGKKPLPEPLPKQKSTVA